MIKEIYKGYTIQAVPVKKQIDKWAVQAVVSKLTDNKKIHEKTFLAEDNIYYILEIEAVKESINLGKNLINKNMAGF